MINFFWVCLLSLFSIGSSVSLNTDDHKENKVDDVCEKPHQEILQRDNYYIMGSGERESIEALYSVFYYASNVNQYLQGWVNCDNQSRFINLVEVGGQSNIDNIVYISQITNNSMPTIFNARRLRFHSYVRNNQYNRMWRYNIGFGNDGNDNEYLLTWAIFTDLTATSAVGDHTAQLVNVYFRYSTNFNSAEYSTPLNTDDYAFTFSKSGTLAQMYDSYINSDADTDFNEGLALGIGRGYHDGYTEGYSVGFTDASAGSPEITSIFTGVLEVGLLPVNVFLSIFNFELFGVNVAGLMTGLLSVGMIFILLRFIFGGKSDDK